MGKSDELTQTHRKKYKINIIIKGKNTENRIKETVKRNRISTYVRKRRTDRKQKECKQDQEES